jgi:hypothetical protein
MTAVEWQAAANTVYAPSFDGLYMMIALGAVLVALWAFES